MKEIKIGDKTIGGNAPVFIIAELSANHGNNYNIAKKTILAAKKAGADAIKLQTYTADTLTIDSNNRFFQINNGTLWDGKTLYELYDEAHTPWSWQPKLKKFAEKNGLIFFSTPYDRTAVDFLMDIGVELFKVASFEIMDIPLIEYIASKGKPIFFSTGISTLEDIKLAVASCKKQKNEDIALLKCTSSYPASLDDINLKTLVDMAERFNAVIGLSDHTLGISVPIASVALGAKIIEKHFILDMTVESPDAFFSLEPDQFEEMVKSVREVEKALGNISYEIPKKVKKSIKFSRSLFIVKDVESGERLTEENIRSIRPGYGLHPKYLKEVINKKAAKKISKGTPLTWQLISR